MSLDIYIIGEMVEEDCTCDTCENVHKRCYRPTIQRFNITHNLCKMAEACQIYNYLWKQEKDEVIFCKQLIPHLAYSINDLIKDPIKFKRLNPANGWGSYEDFVKVLCDLLQACRQHPEAEIETCR